MRKITNYILNGQGFGIKFLAGLSVLMALIFAVAIRIQGAAYIPYAQEIADQMLPIRVVDGQIVEPLDTFKMAQIHLKGREIPMMLPLVLDTRATNLNANLLPQGIYVTRTNIYTVNQNQVKVLKIEGDNYLPSGDYTKVFKTWLNWSAIIGGVAGVIVLFLLYLLLTMFYALCVQIIAKLARRPLAFDGRMRLSAVVLTSAYVLFIPLGWLGINSTILFLAVMLAALICFVVKCVPTAEYAKEQATTSVADNAQLKTMPQNVSETKTSAAKAKSNKKPVDKTETKKPAAQKKKATRKPSAKTAKAKPAGKESK